MNSARSSIFSNSRITPSNIKHSTSPKTNYLQKARQRAAKKLANKYCTCQNYMILSEINRTIMDKQCILKTTINDIRSNQQEQKIDAYYPISRSTAQLPELIEYYKYYSQKTILYMKEYFPLLYQYQQKRKVIEYNRLKVLLNLSDTQKQQNSLRNNKHNDNHSGLPNKSRIGISRNFINDDYTKNKDFLCSNVLDDLSLSYLSIKDEHEQSLLINRLRNNLSKHIGPSHIKNMSIEELDKLFDFRNKKEIFKPSKQNSSLSNLPNQKNKFNSLKHKKVIRQQTHTNTTQQIKQKEIIRRRSDKINNSCENLARISISKNPYEPIICKLKRKKNLSMDNLCTNTSTPYMLEERRETTKTRKIPSKAGERYHKEKENTLASKGPEIFMDTITDLKNKIKKEKQRLIKASNVGTYSSLKRQKPTYTSINTANQRFTKKNYQKLREKTINVQ